MGFLGVYTKLAGRTAQVSFTGSHYGPVNEYTRFVLRESMGNTLISVGTPERTIM